MREVRGGFSAQQTPVPTLQPSAALQPLQWDHFARRRAAATSRRDGTRRWTCWRPAGFRLLPRARNVLTNARHEKSPACKLSQSHSSAEKPLSAPPPSTLGFGSWGGHTRRDVLLRLHRLAVQWLGTSFPLGPG